MYAERHRGRFCVSMNEFNYIKGAYGKTIEDVIRNIFIEVFYHLNGPEILKVPHLVCIPKDSSMVARLIIQRTLESFLQTGNKNDATHLRIADDATRIHLEFIPGVVSEIAQIAKEMTLSPATDDIKFIWQESDIEKCLKAQFVHITQYGKFFYKWRRRNHFANELIKLAHKNR